MNAHHLRKVRRRIARQLRFLVISPHRIIHLSLHQLTRNPCHMKTLLTNWKDIALFAAIAVFFALLSDIISTGSTRGWNPPGLATLTGNLKGFSNFVGANFAAWLIGIAVAWPTLNRFSNESFDAAWQALSQEKRFFTFVGVACLELIAAAICFSA